MLSVGSNPSSGRGWIWGGGARDGAGKGEGADTAACEEGGLAEVAGGVGLWGLPKTGGTVVSA